MQRFLFLLGFGLSFGTSASAQFYLPPTGHERLTTQEVIRQHEVQIGAFRQQALSVERADGGTLTSAHRASLQAQLDCLNVSYGNALRRADALSVDARGAPRS